MRYHYTSSSVGKDQYAIQYICDHPIYDRCTLFKIGDKGLAVVQQRAKGKLTYWDAIDPGLADEVYLHRKFKLYFDKHAAECENGLYPTVTIRQMMWALRMKPLKRERWETYFDRPEI